MYKVLFVLMFAIVSLCIADQANAQSPSMHWGTFTIAAPPHCGGHNWCSATVAPSAMRDEGLRVTVSGNTPSGVGRNVAVLVICDPLGNRSQVTVVASSMNSSVAERFRNNVRTRMVRARCL